ncbi:MAG: hypothetical protein WC315_07855, partial [Candidatus Omnitrophota bacterium]
GNDTIDPYPLIPKEAAKILIVKKDIFEKLRNRYQAFYRSIAGRHVKKSLPVKAHNAYFTKPDRTYTGNNNSSTYATSNAIAVNECDYRRWCRVKEWFAEFNPDAEKFKKTVFIQ